VTALPYCPRCLRSWRYETSGPFGIGGIVKAVHPPGRCVPVVYEPVRLPVKDAKPRPCAVCKAVFTPPTGKHGKSRTCGPECGKKLVRRQRRDYYLNVQRKQLMSEVRSYTRRNGRRAA